MPLRFLLDECCRGEIWDAIRDHNRRSYPTIDAIRVGDIPDLPLRSPDPAILDWAEAQHRVIISRDQATMTAHLQSHLRRGRHCPGLFLIRAGARLADVLAYLEYAGGEGEPEDPADGWYWIP